MADVAELGFAVDSKPLDEAKSKLQDLGTQAQQTGKAVDDFNQKASKAGASLGNGPKQLSADLRELDAAAKLSGTSVNVLQSMATRAGVSIGEMATRVAAARTGIVETAAGAASLGTALNAVSPSARAAAIAVDAKSVSLKDLNRALRQASPLLNEFGGGLGTVLAQSTRLRSVLPVLAAVVGGEVVLAFAKAADEVARSQKLFDALTGSSKSGASALSAARDAAKSSNLEFGTMASALQKAAQGQAVFADKNVIYANSADQAAKNSTKLADGFGTLNRIMETLGATGKEEASVLDAISSSIQKTGTLTGDAFQKIRDASLPTARALSDAFGFKNIEEFQKRLEQTPIPLDELLRKLAQIKPAVDEAFAKRDPTLEQQIRTLGIEWDDLLKKLGQAGGFDLAKGLIKDFGTGLQTDVEDAIALGNAFSTIAGIAGTSFSAIRSSDTLGAMFANDIADVQRLGDAIATLGSMASSVLSNISNGIQSAIARIRDAPSLGSINQDGLFTGGESTPDIQAAPYTPADASYMDAGAFATGGSFTVGGSGGTDSQTVTFKATPGEQVTVDAPGSTTTTTTTTSSASELAKDPDIEDLLNKQTDAIVSAINNLKTTAFSTPSAIATAATAAADTSLSRTLGGPLGGGLASGGASKKSGDKASTPDAPLTPQEIADAIDPYRAARSAASRLANAKTPNASWINPPVGMFGPVGSFGIKDPRSSQDADWDKFKDGLRDVGKNTDDTNRNLDDANRSLDDLSSSSDKTSQEVSSGAQDTVSAVDAASKAISDSVSSIGSMISSALSSVGNAIGSMGGGSSGQGGGSGSGGGFSDSSGYGSSYDGGGYNSGFGSEDYSGDGGSSSSSSYDEGGFSGYSSSSDSSDSGSSSFDESGFEGYFAKGGQFKVGGSGGTDQTPVSFMATKGETVKIFPPGVAPPSSINVPAQMLNPAIKDNVAAPQPVVQSTNKNVNIFVNPGMQAEQFIKSRAQIARAM